MTEEQEQMVRNITGELTDVISKMGMLNEGEELLREWVTWWATDDNAPAKMPNGLHVRSTLYLTKTTASRFRQTQTSSEGG